MTDEKMFIKIHCSLVIKNKHFCGYTRKFQNQIRRCGIMKEVVVLRIKLEFSIQTNFYVVIRVNLRFQKQNPESTSMKDLATTEPNNRE